jgi:K+-transporting ATPase ATPase A chain
MESGEMNTEILGVALQIVLLIVISYPLGKYIAKVYKGEKTWSDFMKPVERLIYKVAGVNPEEEMNWKQFLKALLILNAFWFVWGMVLLCTQQWLPLNPDGNANQTPDLAFNTCISFMVNCNLQHDSGDAGGEDCMLCRQVFLKVENRHCEDRRQHSRGSRQVWRRPVGTFRRYERLAESLTAALL